MISFASAESFFSFACAVAFDAAGRRGPTAYTWRPVSPNQLLAALTASGSYEVGVKSINPSVFSSVLLNYEYNVGILIENVGRHILVHTRENAGADIAG